MVPPLRAGPSDTYPTRGRKAKAPDPAPVQVRGCFCLVGDTGFEPVPTLWLRYWADLLKWPLTLGFATHYRGKPQEGNGIGYPDGDHVGTTTGASQGAQSQK